MNEKRTILIKIHGSDEDQSAMKGQMIASMKNEYNLIFLPDSMDLSDIEWNIIDDYDDNQGFETQEVYL